MTSEADLLRAIRDEPDDDDIRLVYADWFEDQDRLARAEFIRVQIARDWRVTGDPDGSALWQQEHQLLAEHNAHWQAELPPLPDGLTWGEFHRGFVSVRGVTTSMTQATMNLACSPPMVASCRATGNNFEGRAGFPALLSRAHRSPHR